jgi:hypothetical protein
MLIPYSGDEQKLWAKACLTKFPTLEVLMVMISSKHLYAMPPHISHTQIRAVFALQQHLGAPAKLFRVPNYEMEIWFWEAPKGQFEVERYIG